VYDAYCAACDRARDAWKQCNSEQAAVRQDINQGMAAEGLEQTADGQKKFRERHPDLFRRLSQVNSTLQETLKTIGADLKRDLEALPSGSH
jgi:hypothetical protein